MEIKDLVPPILKDNVVVTTVDALFKWAHGNSIWPLSSGLACCAIEMMSTAAARFDLSRFGYEVFRPCPRQADLLIVAGTLTWKMTPPLIRLYVYHRLYLHTDYHITISQHELSNLLQYLEGINLYRRLSL